MFMTPRGIEPLTFGLGTGVQQPAGPRNHGLEGTASAPKRRGVHSPATMESRAATGVR